jgi:AsmA protein
MKKYIVIPLVLALIVVGAVFALPQLLSSEAVRLEFGKKISAMSGMDITLGGPVNFSVFPDIGLVAKDVKLATPDGNFLVAVSKIVSGVKLSSVFSDKIEITALSLIQPEITITETDRGENPQETVKSNEDSITNADLFAAAIGQLESLSLKKFTIKEGKFISRSAAGARSTISNIDGELRAPSLDGELNLTLSATRDGQNISLTASLAALRQILQRQPSKIDMALKIQPAPHPALADLTASGDILLNKDGSYQISDGLFTSLGQPLRLDVLYRPGERPYSAIDLRASHVDLGIIEKAVQTEAGTKTKTETTVNSQPDVAIIDLAPLVGFDADITLKVGRFTMDNIEVRAIDMGAALKNGVLEIDLENAGIGRGAVAAKLTTDANKSEPTFRGSLTASALAIEDFGRLANIDLPLAGNLGLKIGYAFRGLSENSIKNTFNLAGQVNLSDGTVTVPAPDQLGNSAKTVSDLNLEAIISHAQKPIDMKGKMAWNGETINFGSLVAPHDFIKNNAGRVSLTVRSGKLNADYTGDIDLNGSASGRLKLSTKSLGKLMAWVGQGDNADLKAFSYDGNIKVNANNFVFEKASIALNGIEAAGSGSLGLSGKPSIATNLSFELLDIAALIGGGTKNSENSNSGSSNDMPIDLSALRSFDADIKVKAKKVIYGKVTGGPVNTTLIVKDGVAHAALPQTPFYGGGVLADIVADGSGETPAINIDAKLSNIDALPLFSDAADFKRIEGKLNSKFEIKGAGKTTGQISKSLKGSSSAQFTDGAIRGVDIANIYNNLTAVLAGGFNDNENDKTAFAELSLSYLIDQGVATTDDIKLLGPLVRMDGAGKVDLGEENIDMRLNPLVVMSSTGQGGEFDLEGIGIPILINGPLGSPRVYPDLKEVMKNPQAAIDFVSKLGINLKSLGTGDDGSGKNVIENLITKIAPGEGTGGTGGAEGVVNSLIGNLINPNAASSNGNQTNQVSNGEQPATDSGGGSNTSGIPVPTLNPLRQAAVNSTPKTATEQIVDQVLPQANSPLSEETTKKALKSLLDGITQ